MWIPQLRILLVQNDALIRPAIADALVEAGFHVTQACSAETALALLSKQRAFDLLLTDVEMPGRLNGIDVARHVRSAWPGMPVVFATGHPEAVRDFGTLGPQDHCIVKPYRPARVLGVIQSCLPRTTDAQQRPTDYPCHA